MGTDRPWWENDSNAGSTGQEPPKAVLEGTIVPYEPPERERKRRYTANLDDDTVAEIVRRRLTGESLRPLAQEYGVSHESIRRWCGQAVDKVARESGQIARVRAKLIHELETVDHRLWEIVRTAQHPKVILDALLQIQNTVRGRAMLAGANAPIKHDVQVTEVTEAERELQELINEAKARAHNAEARVIADATADGEL